MPASLRIELFPASLDKFIDFYTRILSFTLLKRKDTYAYLQRDNIYLGAIETSTKDSLDSRVAYRQPNKGVEIVFELDDLVSERDRIVALGYKLDANIERQEWGLDDVRLTDPDGYYIRITNRAHVVEPSER
jgi:catechol 2,3-dioxygenase-like lactoylglutathione lyase family enzyme